MEVGNDNEPFGIGVAHKGEYMFVVVGCAVSVVAMNFLVLPHQCAAVDGEVE